MILVYHRHARIYARLIQERFPGVAVAQTSDPAEIRRRAAGAEIILASPFPVDALAGATGLRWIQCTNAGVDFLVPARAHLDGVVVTNVSGMHGSVMADYAIGVMVMLQWNFRGLFAEQQARKWRARYVEPLEGKTLGIVGLGSIGTTIARRAGALGLRVVGVKRSPEPVEGVDHVHGPAELGAVLPQCDFVLLAVPSTAETRRMIGAPELGAMRKGAFLINVARGDIVDEAALIQALESGHLGGAALDVFAVEPPAPDNPLWSMPNVIVTPHVAGAPAMYVERAFEIFAENLERFRSGMPLRNVVDLALGY